MSFSLDGSAVDNNKAFPSAITIIPSPAYPNKSSFISNQALKPRVSEIRTKVPVDNNHGDDKETNTNKEGNAVIYDNI